MNDTDDAQRKALVDQYSGYGPGRIEPGESRYFKVACDCRDAKPADFDSYKVRFVNDF